MRMRTAFEQGITERTELLLIISLFSPLPPVIEFFVSPCLRGEE
jgi:hypothetical protein